MEPMETTVAETPSRGGKHLEKSSSHLGLWISAGLVGALAALYIGLCAWAVHAPTLYPGLTVGGVDVGGLEQSAAATVLQNAPRPADTTALTLTLTDRGGQALPQAQPLSLTYGDLGGVERDAAQAAANAFAYCHDGSFFLHGWRYLRSALGQTDLPVALTAPALDAQALAESLSQPAVQADYQLRENALDVTVPRDGWLIAPADLETALQAALSGTAADLTCPASTLPGGDALTAQSLSNALAGDMHNAGYDSATDSFYPAQAHASFNVPAAQTQLDSALPGSTVEIAAVTELPTVTEEDLKATLFRDVLGEYTTKVGGSKGRKTNVRLSAEALNGLVLNDRETFSYNQAVGKRTPEKGYQSAPAYLNGETVMEYGGGVCQTSSTLYLASLLADLEITERYAHRYVPAYMPAGMDATVSWGGPDYKFTNNTGYPIRIETSYVKDRLTVKLWGTNVDGTSVKMTNQWLSTTNFEVVYEEDPTLAPGQEKVITTPYTGQKYKTFRNRYDKDGKLISSTYEATSNYKARNKVIARGPAVETVTPPPTEPILPIDPQPQLPVNPDPVVPVDPQPVVPAPVEPTPPAPVLPDDGFEVIDPITPIEPIA